MSDTFTIDFLGSRGIWAEKEVRLQKNLELLMSGRFSDFKIIADRKTFDVHRNILSGHMYFDAMFCSENRENLSNELTITDFNEEVVFILLHYMYTGSVKLSGFYGHMEDVLRASDKYNLDGLLRECERYLIRNLNESNAIRYVLLAKQCNSTRFREAAMDFICEHAEELEKTEDWKLLAKENVLIVDAIKSRAKNAKFLTIE